MVRDIQALRSFLKPTSDSSPAMMPSSHSGLVGTGVALDGGVPEGGGATVSGPPTTNGSLVADAGLVPIMFVAVTAQVYDTPLVRPETAIGEVGLAPKSNLSPKQ